MINFEGKTVLVTGGGAGIGRGVAEAFGAHGARVVVAEIDAKRAADVGGALKKAGVEAHVQTCDVRKKSDVEALAKEIGTRFGGLDFLVNNVGDYAGIYKPFDDMTDDEFETLYAVNLKHIFLVTRAMLPLLRKTAPGGSIISVSTIEAFRGCPHNVVYSAFKAGIVGFTQSLAVELAPSGIRVNAIAPETTHTKQVPIYDMIAEANKDKIPRWIPLGRFGQPSDLAGCALFLASPLSAWVTGITINLDGGALAAGAWYQYAKNRWTNTPIITGQGFGAP